MESHAERVRHAFSEQAGAFEDARHNHLFTDEARWLFDGLACGEQDLLLDVAAGTGHAARALAPRVRAALAIDITPEMLEAGRRAATQAGVANVVFLQGDAEALPFLDGSFDVVVCRFALHHIQRPQAVVGEMARCLRAGGRLGVADMVAEEDPEIAAAQNAVERMRESSHTQMLRVSELEGLLAAAGMRDIAAEAREVRRPLQPWLEHAKTPPQQADAVRALVEAELAGGAPSGLAPRREADGSLTFRQRWASVLGVAPG